MNRTIPGIGKIDYFTALYTSSYASLGALFPLIGQYLSGIGFSGAQIGVVSACATATGIFANPLWGNLYHRHHRSKRLVLLLCVLSGVLALALPIAHTFEIFLLLYVVVFFFENPIFPLLDATTIEANYPFGGARKWGAVGYALGIGIAGPLSDAFGLDKIFFLFAGFFFLTALFLHAYLKHRKKAEGISWGDAEPNASSYGRGEAVLSQEECMLTDEALPREIAEELSGKGKFRDLLINRKYVALLACTFFICGPSFAHNIYFSFLYIGQGGTIAGMGVAMLLMALSEAPFMSASNVLCRKFGAEKMLLAAMVVAAIRFLWYGTGPAPELITGTFFLQGFVNGIILVETVKYIKRLVGTEMVSLAIPLYTALSSNCGTIACQLLGGILVSRYGGEGVYLVYGVMNVIGIVIFIAYGLHRPMKPGTDCK